MSDPTTSATPGDKPKPKPEATPPTPPAAAANDWRKSAGGIVSVVVVCGAVVLALWVWRVMEHHPRTDDAVVRANVVGIAPRVRGQIIKLNVEDNQEVKAGDVLFEIDPEDYRLALEKAKAALEATDQQIEVAKAQDSGLKFQVKAAEAGVAQAKSELKLAGDSLQRLQPLLPNGFTTTNDVDKAQTAEAVATAALATEEERLNEAKTALSALATLQAQRPGVVAAVDLAALELSYCKVIAPFPGRVIGLNLSAGAYASGGVPVFSMLDTRKWYVMANFREGEIGHIPAGATADIYLPAAPERHFIGKVQSIGWAVEPAGEIDLPHGLPYVKRELNWVHVAQRFPVRIEIEEPDPLLFRMGASAVVIIKSAQGSQ